MKRFKKKPVVIDAIQWDGDTDTIDLLVKAGLVNFWFDVIGGQMVNFRIETLEGVMTVNEGDWVIKGVEGEFYPCKDSAFHKSYDPVGDWVC